MSNTNAPSEAPEYDTTSTVSRNSDEAYALDVWLLSGPTTPSTRAYTYGRTEGLYKLSPSDTEEVVEAFDDALAALQEKYGAVDEFEFERLSGDAYEVMAEVIPTAEAAPYDAEFDHNTAVVHVTSENDPELVEALDDAFETLNAFVADQ